MAKTSEALSTLAVINIGRQWQSAIQLVGGTTTAYFLSRLVQAGSVSEAALKQNRIVSTAYAFAIATLSWIGVRLIELVYFGKSEPRTTSLLLTLCLASAAIQYLNPISNLNYATSRIKHQIFQNLGLSIAFVATYFLARGDSGARFEIATLVSTGFLFIAQTTLFFVLRRSLSSFAIDIAFGAGLVILAAFLK